MARLDSRNGDRGWQCFDVERCALITPVVFVDEESATWGESDLSPEGQIFAFVRGEPKVILHHEKRIRIVHGQRMVLFNSLDDGDSSETETVYDVLAEAAR